MGIKACRAISRRSMLRWVDGTPGMYATNVEEFWKIQDLTSSFDAVHVISISDVDVKPIEFHPDFGALILQFDDIDPDDSGCGGAGNWIDESGCRVFPDSGLLIRAEQARAIKEFILRKHQETPLSNDLLLVNCHMGVSRSGAVITVAGELCGIDVKAIDRMNPGISPNLYVMRLIRDSHADL